MWYVFGCLTSGNPFLFFVVFVVEISIIQYLVYWLILYLLKPIYFYYLNYCSMYIFWFFLRKLIAVYICQMILFYVYRSSLIDSLLLLICMLFLSIWFTVASMFVAVLPRSFIFAYLFSIIHLVQWLFLIFLLRSVCWFFLILLQACIFIIVDDYDKHVYI